MCRETTSQARSSARARTHARTLDCSSVLQRHPGPSPAQERKTVYLQWLIMEQGSKATPPFSC